MCGLTDYGNAMNQVKNSMSRFGPHKPFLNILACGDITCLFAVTIFFSLNEMFIQGSMQKHLHVLFTKLLKSQLTYLEKRFDQHQGDWG